MSGDNKIDAAQHQMNGALETILGEVKKLKHLLDLMEKRALDWEQMHHDQIMINTGLNTQNNDLRKELEGARVALRDQIERNQPNHGLRLAERMEKIAIEDQEFRKNCALDEDKKRNEHNSAIRESVSKQTRIMDANLRLHEINTATQTKAQELILRSVLSSEKQTLLLENMSACMGEMVIALKGLPTRQI